MILTVHSIKYLQAISRRIHYGKFVAEVKFRDAPQDYEPLIRAKVCGLLCVGLAYLVP